VSTASRPKSLDEILQEFAQHRRLMQEELQKVIVGQADVIEQLFAAIFTRGHCLLEGVPGLAKTLMVSTLARILDVGFKRVQFTPDLMPSDITGTNVLDDEAGRRVFRFVEGPIFTNILLADEINRTPPKTQAAGGGGGDVVGITAHAIAHDFGQHRGAAGAGAIQALQHQHSGAFADHEAIPLRIEGPTGAAGIVIAK